MTVAAAVESCDIQPIEIAGKRVKAFGFGAGLFTAGRRIWRGLVQIPSCEVFSQRLNFKLERTLNARDERNDPLRHPREEVVHNTGLVALLYQIVQQELPETLLSDASCALSTLCFCLQNPRKIPMQLNQ